MGRGTGNEWNGRRAVCINDEKPHLLRWGGFHFFASMNWVHRVAANKDGSVKYRLCLRFIVQTFNFDKIYAEDDNLAKLQEAVDNNCKEQPHVLAAIHDRKAELRQDHYQHGE